jgi:hypothetical protein
MTPVTRTPATVSRTTLLFGRLLAVLTAGAHKRGSRSRDLDISVLLRTGTSGGAMAIAVLGM